jgi:hypothetical protein
MAVDNNYTPVVHPVNGHRWKTTSAKAPPRLAGPSPSVRRPMTGPVNPLAPLGVGLRP